MRPLEDKALRLTLKGKVTVDWSTRGAASGLVEGDHGTYQVAFNPERKVCTCTAGVNHRPCSHVLALELAALSKEQNG